MGVEAFVVIVSPDDPVPAGESWTLDGLRLSPGPFTTSGVMETVRLTVPVKPLMLVSVIVEKPVEPAAIGSDCGLPEMEKSTTSTPTLAV